MKLLLLDKDGTLIRPASGAKFVNQPWDQQAIPGVAEALSEYCSEGWLPVIISNQGGIASGYKSLQQAFDEMAFVLELFPGIAEAYFCPDMQGAECWQVWGDCSEDCRIWHTSQSYKTWELGIAGQYRKPNPGMLKLAIDSYNAQDVLMVGDRPEDQQAAEAAGVPFLWVQTWLKSVE